MREPVDGNRMLPEQQQTQRLYIMPLAANNQQFIRNTVHFGAFHADPTLTYTHHYSNTANFFSRQCQIKMFAYPITYTVHPIFGFTIATLTLLQFCLVRIMASTNAGYRQSDSVVAHIME